MTSRDRHIQTTGLLYSLSPATAGAALQGLRPPGETRGGLARDRRILPADRQPGAALPVAVVREQFAGHHVGCFLCLRQQGKVPLIRTAVEAIRASARPGLPDAHSRDGRHLRHHMLTVPTPPATQLRAQSSPSSSSCAALKRVHFGHPTTDCRSHRSRCGIGGRPTLVETTPGAQDPAEVWPSDEVRPRRDGVTSARSTPAARTRWPIPTDLCRKSTGRRR